MPARVPTIKRRGLVALATRQDLVAQLHPTHNPLALDPGRIPVGSHTRLWWVCPVAGDHAWEAAVGSRTAGRGCRACAGYQVSVTNSLAALHPQVAAQFNEADPRNLGKSAADFTAGSHAKVWWACPVAADHQWEAAVFSRTSGGNGCPSCAGQQVSVTNCLAALKPEVAAQLDPALNDGLTPDRVAAASHVVLTWRCDKGPDHTWPARVDSRKSVAGCACCAGRRASVTNSLATLFPDIAREYAAALNDGLTADQVVAGACTKKAWWRCSKNPAHAWQATPDARTRIGTGCPYCSGYRASPEHNLVVKYPRVAAQFDHAAHGNANIVLEHLTPASGALVAWRCDKGPDHTWSARVGTRTSKGNGCPFCANRRLSVTSSLATLHRDLAAQFAQELNAGLTAGDVLAGTNDRRWWRCSVNHSHTWEATVASRTGAGNGCPDCQLNGHSEIEIRVAHELAACLGVDLGVHRVRGHAQWWSADIVARAARLVVEYDGEYWHRDKQDLDLRKTRDLEAAGWTVVRIRAGLAELGDHDVVVSSRDTAHTVAVAVLRLLLDVRPDAISPAVVHAYIAAGVPVAAKSATRYLGALRALAARA